LSLLGSAFPATLSGLCTRTPLQSTGSLRRELAWTTELLLHCQKQLNIFLQASALFERHLLIGDFKKARATIVELTKSLGWSLWAVQSELLVADLEEGISGNRGKLAEIFQTSSRVVKIFAYFFSLRVEASSSATSYDTDILNHLSRAEATPRVD